MFWKRQPRPVPPPQAPRASSDPELDALHAALAARQEQLAALQLDLFQSRAELAQFNAELERHLGPLQRQVEALEKALAEVRQRVSRRAVWADRAESRDTPEDVVVQYQRLWGRTADPDPHSPSGKSSRDRERPSAEPDPRVEAELRSLYRALARRFHPDLARDPAEKAWRAERMARVNDAYAARNLAALRRLAADPNPPAAPAAKTRDQVVAELRAEIERLTALAAELERELDMLAGSAAVQLKLDALFARRSGRDLLAEMARDLQADVARLERELAALL